MLFFFFLYFILSLEISANATVRKRIDRPRVYRYSSTVFIVKRFNGHGIFIFHCVPATWITSDAPRWTMNHVRSSYAFLGVRHREIIARPSCFATGFRGPRCLPWTAVTSGARDHRSIRGTVCVQIDIFTSMESFPRLVPAPIPLIRRSHWRNRRKDGPSSATTSKNFSRRQ